MGKRRQRVTSHHCAYCKVRLVRKMRSNGTPVPEHPTKDHFYPKSRFIHSDQPENILIACYRCNNEKGGLTPNEWRARLDRDDPRRKAVEDLLTRIYVPDLEEHV